jgi:structural maintenance of chromosome 2
VTINEHKAALESVSNLENLVQTITTGLTSSKGRENGYMEQLSNARNSESEAAAEIQKLKVKMSHITKELKEAEPRAKAAQKENTALFNELQQHKASVANMEKELSSTFADQDKEKGLEIARMAKRDEISFISNEIELLGRSQSGLQFNYSDPVPNFDRSLVKGLVAELIDIPQENLDSSTALEICAGGKLYNVISFNIRLLSRLRRLAPN